MINYVWIQDESARRELLRRLGKRLRLLKFPAIRDLRCLRNIPKKNTLV